MPEVDDRLEQIKGRGCGVFFLAAPVVMFIFVVIAYSAFGWYGLQGRPAQGDLAVLTFEGCAAGQAALQERLVMMGFSSTVEAVGEGKFAVQLVLPEDEEVAATLPHTLTRPGQFVLRDGSGEQVLLGPERVRSASHRLDLLMNPSLVVKIPHEDAQSLRKRQEHSPYGQLSFWLDGERIGGQKNLKPLEGDELEVVPPMADERSQMEAVAAWSVVVAHPLPCQVAWVTTERQSTAEDL
jgi:hypothetical protein